MLPIRMRPLPPRGHDPWGRGRLREALRHGHPDPRTGEALLVSAIPGLESRDDSAVRLTKLIARYGKALWAGTGVSPC